MEVKAGSLYAMGAGRWALGDDGRLWPMTPPRAACKKFTSTRCALQLRKVSYWTFESN